MASESQEQVKLQTNKSNTPVSSDLNENGEDEMVSEDGQAATESEITSDVEDTTEEQEPQEEDEALPQASEQLVQEQHEGWECVESTIMANIPEGDEEDPTSEKDVQSPVPQSDTFTEGEEPEGPVTVGEILSREGSPTGTATEAVMPERPLSPPVPSTPPDHACDEEEDYDDEEDDEDDELQFDRELLIERYHQALSQRQQLQEQNYQLQHKLTEYFRRKKADERQDMDKNVTDQEQRYLKYMANLDELRLQDSEERESFIQQIEDMKERCDEKKRKVDEEQQKFKEFKKEVAYGSLNSRSGKPIPAKDVEQHFVNESRKEEEVVKVRLDNIKLKNKLKKKEAQLKSKEELAEGLHMIDFEQLKIENQTYNEKIEERNEELLKLRKKITSTVQVLTHLKEKLQFVQGENGILKGTLKEVEEHAAKKRDILSRTKQARDGLRIDNQRLRQNCGLLGNEPLLRDFEQRKDDSDGLKDKLEEMKMLHAELTLNLNGVRRKIQQAQVGRQ